MRVSGRVSHMGEADLHVAPGSIKAMSSASRIVADTNYGLRSLSKTYQLINSAKRASSWRWSIRLTISARKWLWSLYDSTGFGPVGKLDAVCLELLSIRAESCNLYRRQKR